MLIEEQIVLKAEEGKVLTNGTDFGKVVYVGKNDSQNNWQEITIEEANELQKEEQE
jgi:hypothetical protein